MWQVKSNTVYETVRMLGRGSFGDVNLGKNVPQEYSDKIFLSLVAPVVSYMNNLNALLPHKC